MRKDSARKHRGEENRNFSRTRVARLPTAMLIFAVTSVTRKVKNESRKEDFFEKRGAKSVFLFVVPS